MAEFDDWAPYYDLIHRGLPGEAEFYVSLGKQCAGPLLELGCGTGRVALALASAGLEVTGLDNSAQMLALCRYKQEAIGALEGSLEVVQADMADFDLGQRFDLIVAPYRTFMHLHERAGQRACLECVREHLADAGSFVLNVWVPSTAIVSAHAVRREEFEFVDEYATDGPGRVRHYHRVVYDESQQQIREEHLLDEVDEAGNVLESTVLPLLRTWTTPREMAGLARAAGLRVKSLSSGFDGEAYRGPGSEAVWVLEKRA